MGGRLLQDLLQGPVLQPSTNGAKVNCGTSRVGVGPEIPAQTGRLAVTLFNVSSAL